MREKYLAFLKESLLSQQSTQTIFFILIKYFEISELKKLPEFNQLKDTVIQLSIYPEETFAKAVLWAVQRQKFYTVKFLIDECIDECGYDLTQTHYNGKITLLHDACLIGSKEIIEYLLQKGFSPNVKDSVGETPLHRVFKRKDKDIAVFISLLKKYQADLNIETHSGLTALHMSVIHNNPKATSTLIDLGANEALIWNGFTYSTLKTAIQNRVFHFKQPTVALSLPEENITEKTFAAYCKGCLLPTFDKSIFQTIINGLLLKKNVKLNPGEIEIFLKSSVLSLFDYSQPKAVKKTLFALIKNNKVDRSNAVLNLLKISTFFVEQKQTDSIKKLNSLALKLLDAKDIPSEKKCDFYHVIGVRYKDIGLFKKSESCLQQALQNSSLKTDEFKLQIFFNLGCTQLFLMKHEAALENFRKAFYLNKDDIETFQRYISLLLECKQYEEALKVCHAVNFGRFSEIFAVFTRTLSGDSNWSNLLEMVKKDSSDEETQILVLNLRSECYLKCGNYDAAIEAGEQAFILHEKSFKKDNNNDISQAICKVLLTFIQAKKYELGLARLKAIEEIYSFEFNLSALCQRAASVLYIANQQFVSAELAMQKIQRLGVEANVLSDLYCELSVEVLLINPKNNCARALEYINLALKLNRNNLTYQFYKLLLLILTENKEAAEKTLQTIEQEKLLDISLAKNVLKKEHALPESISADVSAIQAVFKPDEVNQEQKDSVSEEQEETLAVKDYDAAKIHQFFQAEKQRLLHESMATLSQTPQPKAKWQIGSASFEEGKDGLTSIKHHSYSACYAVINPNLALADDLRKTFQAALSNKGTAKRKKNDGVQTLNNSIVQLAIKADNRLYTRVIYRNEDGQHLIVFEHHGNHKEVNRLASKERPLQVIPLTQPNQSSQYIPRSDSIFTVPTVPPEIQPSDGQIPGVIDHLCGAYLK